MLRAVGYYYHHHRPVEGVMDNCYVVHSHAEERQLRESGWYPQEGSFSSSFVNGIWASVKANAPQQNFILNVFSPPFNALRIRHWSVRTSPEVRDFVPDHTFVPRVPDPGDGGDDPVRQAYARCEGCYRLGYHLPGREVRCSAFGVPEPPVATRNDFAPWPQPPDPQDDPATADPATTIDATEAYPSPPSSPSPPPPNQP